MSAGLATRADLKDALTLEEAYQALWRTFHETAAIPERANALCQRTHLPLRYRPYMTEFQKGNPRGI